MKEIIKTLLLEGIDEATIHRVLDVIEEEYEVISELDDETVKSVLAKREANYLDTDGREKLLKRHELKRAQLAADLRDIRKGNKISTEDDKQFIKGRHKVEQGIVTVRKGIAQSNKNMQLRGQKQKLESGALHDVGKEYTKHRIKQLENKAEVK